MNVFDQLNCMVADGAITQGQQSLLRLTLKSMPDSEIDVLKLLTAAIISGVGAPSVDVEPPLYKTANFTASSGDRIFADTSAGAFTITLPLTPSVGDHIEIFDAQSSFATHNLTISRNGQLIDSNAGNLISNLDNVHFTLYFNDGAIGWAVYNM